MKIIEYKLHAYNSKGAMTTPNWVSHGGQFRDPEDYTMIGMVPEEADREYYVPDTLTYYTLEELKARNVAMHNTKGAWKKMNEDGSMEDMTDAEVEAETENWYNSYS